MRQRDSYRFPFAAYPAVRIMLLMVIGISVAEVFAISLPIIIAMFIISLLGWILFEFILRRKFMVLSGHGSALFYSALIISTSLMFIGLQNERLSIEIEESKPLEFYEWEDVRILGEITKAGKSSSGRGVFIVDVEETKIPDGLTWKKDYNIRFYADHNLDEQLSEGDLIDATIRIYDFPEPRNPHEFDYGAWLNSQGISAHGELSEVIKFEDGRWFNLGTIRNSVLKNIDELLDKESGSLAKALLLGYKDDLTPENKQQFSRAGLSHIMAVSGLHVGFIVAPFWWFIPYLWGSKRGKWLGLIFITILLIGYAGLTGFSPSVSRASLMAWLLTYGRLFHKVRNSVNLTAVAAVILLMINPAQLFDPGFQLSFSAVFIILLVMPEAQRLIPRKYHFGKIGKLVAIIVVSIVVQLGLFPILINYFGEFSIVGPISNALVIPILTVVVPAGLIIVVLIDPIIPTFSQILAIPIEYLLEWIQYIASFTGGTSFSFISLNELSLMLFLIWLFAILLTASLRIPKMRWKILICLLLAMNALIIEEVVDQRESKKLEVTFLDVGQGDAIHVKTPNEKNMLIDTGRWSPGGNSGEDVILPYFKEMGIDHLDAIILSHPHADHIGGITEVINEIEVDTIYQSDVEYDSNLYRSYMQLAHENKIQVNYPQAGDIINLDSSLRIFVLGPEKSAFQSNPNNRSVAIKIVYGETSILFSGDAEKEQEELIAARYEEFLKSDLYKAGHHGSNTSSTASFMRYIKPEATITSLAFENRFGHPGSQAVSRLNQFSDLQNYTSLEGAVVYESDGQSFRKIDWKD